MAVIEDRIVWLLAMTLLLFAVVCFLYVWWAMSREARRGHSYEPLPPKDDPRED
jgi:cbb3-type cytochrome oxidase subunit 3